MSDKKYNIDLVNNVSGWGYPKAHRLHCASWSKEQIEKYLNELATTTNIPQGSCLFNLCASFNAYHEIKVMLSDFPTATKDCSNGGLDINISFRNGHKCPREKCFKNIQSGKCTDKFVIDNIGKKFFADKYSEKQK